jgi:hypothetical protein
VANSQQIRANRKTAKTGKVTTFLTKQVRPIRMKRKGREINSKTDNNMFKDIYGNTPVHVAIIQVKCISLH